MELTKEEKINIIEQHQKNIVYNKFNTEMSIVEENAKNTPDTSVVTALNAKITESVAQLAALQIELNNLG
jgi:hypothetical protein